MKKVIILLLFIIIGSVIYQSYSYTSALVGQQVAYNVVSEGQALVSIEYDEINHSFTLTNNTEDTIEIRHITIDQHSLITNGNISDPYLIPGKRKEYFIDGADLLTGAQMNISIISENMKMDISSILPQFIEKEDEDEDEEADNLEEEDQDEKTDILEEEIELMDKQELNELRSDKNEE